MKLSMEWLSDFTPLTVDAKTLCNEMTLSGSKVEGCVELGQDIQNVRTARIARITRHPNADKLVVCQVDNGNETVTVVTGAPNVFEGAIVPVALVGAQLPGGVTISSGELRGVLSDGMLVSVQELGFTPADFPGLDAAENGILILPEDTPLGVDIREVLGLSDTQIDFEITSNRVDCFCVEGLAREAAATFQLPFKPRVPAVLERAEGAAADFAQVRIDAPDLCQRYAARIVRDVTVGPSPMWMQRRLRAAGMRSINNIVDITNYVMLELGQPMHAFDLTDLAGASIIVRRARNDEQMKTLDGGLRQLDNDMLVIADASRAVAIAGVMGAENSEVKPATQTLLLESATFQPTSVRRTAHRAGLRTEASSRFEKGLDPLQVERALDRACELIEQLGCGNVCPGVIDAFPNRPEPAVIPFAADRINGLLGTAIPVSEMSEILARLDVILSHQEGRLVANIPSFRPDLECMADLAEEVARFHGYNTIAPTLLSGKETTLGGLSQQQIMRASMQTVLETYGFFEAMTYSFESPRQLDRLQLPADHPLRQRVVIQNPLGEDFSCMRTSMLPSLLESIAINNSRSARSACLYERAYTYHPVSLPMTGLPDEVEHLTAIAYDLEHDQKSGRLFFEMKAAVLELAVQLGMEEPVFIPLSDDPTLHPNRSARIQIGQEPIGVIGTLHPAVAEAFAVPESTVVLDLSCAPILKLGHFDRTCRSLPRYPAVSRDLAFLMDSRIPVGDLLNLLRSLGGDYLESASLFDVYHGHQVQPGKKSVAFNLVFRKNNGTLKDEDIAPAINSMITTAAARLGAQLRE